MTSEERHGQRVWAPRVTALSQYSILDTFQQVFSVWELRGQDIAMTGHHRKGRCWKGAFLMSKPAAAGRGGTCLQSRDLEDEEGGLRAGSQPGLPNNTWPLEKQILLQTGQENILKQGNKVCT